MRGRQANRGGSGEVLGDDSIFGKQRILKCRREPIMIQLPVNHLVASQGDIVVGGFSCNNPVHQLREFSPLDTLGGHGIGQPVQGSISAVLLSSGTRIFLYRLDGFSQSTKCFNVLRS